MGLMATLPPKRLAGLVASTILIISRSWLWQAVSAAWTIKEARVEAFDMLRKALPQDAPEIVRVYLATWRSHGSVLLRTGEPATASTLDDEAQQQQLKRFTFFLESGQRHFIVAEDDGAARQQRLSAFISFGPSYTRDGFGEVMQLFVHPDFQRRGLGSKLLQAAWLELRDRTWSKMGCHVWCTKGNPANRVYEQAGWFPTGRQKSLKPSLSKDPVEVEEFQAPQAKGPNSWQSWRGPRFLLGLAVGILVGAVMKAALLRGRSS
ncbi:hypothetical protein AK812_SmicGene31982 [Symbiodinium microadriaticum]|uniref:N-acetyltransferase domain-containing protein n=1 Tax=Symbiodinium microadriaticum TaxID=2951 RepID=A0A1Q9CVB9_SYMMI|nr:hypothetical protein AK812_SmicGene31982 [Symbiodinium microadriaticum]